jgi:hypothetical protein
VATERKRRQRCGGWVVAAGGGMGWWWAGESWRWLAAMAGGDGEAAVAATHAAPVGLRRCVLGGLHPPNHGTLAAARWSLLARQQRRHAKQVRVATAVVAATGRRSSRTRHQRRRRAQRRAVPRRLSSPCSLLTARGPLAARPLSPSEGSRVSIARRSGAARFASALPQRRPHSHGHAAAAQRRRHRRRRQQRRHEKKSATLDRSPQSPM